MPFNLKVRVPAQPSSAVLPLDPLGIITLHQYDVPTMSSSQFVLLFAWPGFSAQNGRVDGEGVLNFMDEVTSTTSCIVFEACASMALF